MECDFLVLFFIVLILNIPYAKCCVLMKRKYHLTIMIIYLLFCVLKSVYPIQNLNDIKQTSNE